MTKKRTLERELEQAGWKKVKRSHGGHDKFTKQGMRSVAVPRHSEIKDETAELIRREAGLK